MYVKVASVSAGCSDGGNNVQTADIVTTGANLIVVSVGTYTGVGAPAPTDSKSNTWQSLTLTATGATRQQLFYAYNPTVGTGHNFSVATGGGFPAVAAIAFSGAVASPFDVENGAGSLGSSSIMTGSVTPSEISELFITGLTWDGAITNLAIDLSFTKDQEVSYQASQHLGLALGYFIQGSPLGALNPTWSWTTARANSTRIATFKAAPTNSQLMFRGS